MNLLMIDIAPGPPRLGVAVGAILFVIASLGLITGALVFLLWYRKRNMRHNEIIDRRGLSVAPADGIQSSNPNQP